MSGNKDKYKPISDIPEKWAQHIEQALEKIVREEFDAALLNAKKEAEINIERRKRELMSRVVVSMSSAFQYRLDRDAILIEIKFKDVREGV